MKWWPPKRNLDPNRATRVRDDFEQGRGYRAYAGHCRKTAGRASAESGPGVSFQTVLTEAEAANTLAGLRAAQIGIAPNDKGIDYSEELRFGDPGPLEQLAAMTLDRLDTILAGWLGCEYRVHRAAVHRTMPAGESRRSFLWHCDRGPRDHLKILLYLNAGHGGSTEFLSRANTEEFERIGYVFGPNKQRLADLSPLAQRHAIQYTPIRHNIRAGEAVIFEPSNVLHRGILPNSGDRYHLSLILLPSEKPWRESVATPMGEGTEIFPNAKPLYQ